MVEFFDPIANKNISYHLDEKLKSKWDKLKDGKLAEINEDRVYIVDGRERTGKSSFVFQQAKYIDPSFTLDRICFRPEDFLQQIRNAPKGGVVVFDEAFRGLSSKASRSKTNKAIVEALMEVGQRNLIIFIVLPTIFLLEIYAAAFRTEALFHVYKTKKRNASGVKQRAFKIYNYQKKMQLYLIGKTKYFSYAKPKITRAKGRFYVKQMQIEGIDNKIGVPYETFPMLDYIKKKDEAFKQSGTNKEQDEESKYKLQRDYIINGMYNDFIKSHRKLSDWLESKKVGLSRTQVANIIGKTMENAENDN